MSVPRAVATGSKLSSVRTFQTAISCLTDDPVATALGTDCEPRRAQQSSVVTAFSFHNLTTTGGNGKARRIISSRMCPANRSNAADTPPPMTIISGFKALTIVAAATPR